MRVNKGMFIGFAGILLALSLGFSGCKNGGGGGDSGGDGGDGGNGKGLTITGLSRYNGHYITAFTGNSQDLDDPLICGASLPDDSDSVKGVKVSSGKATLNVYQMTEPNYSAYTNSRKNIAFFVYESSSQNMELKTYENCEEVGEFYVDLSSGAGTGELRELLETDETDYADSTTYSNEIANKNVPWTITDGTIG
jgi:hypothetical protein